MGMIGFEVAGTTIWINAADGTWVNYTGRFDGKRSRHYISGEEVEQCEHMVLTAFLGCPTCHENGGGDE